MKNIFTGDGSKATLAKTAYHLLMQKRWVSNIDVLNASPYSRSQNANGVSNSIVYGELKKAMSELIRLLNDKIPGCIVSEGTTRNRRHKYTAGNPDPLADLLNAVKVQNLNDYIQFCKDSVGLMPFSWIEYFFSGTQNLLEIKNSRPCIASSAATDLKNINLLPELYQHIISRHVLSIDYAPYDLPRMHYTLHPQFLKEYNGRWHLYGFEEEHPDIMPFHIALDRIVPPIKVVEHPTADYHPEPSEGYYDFFFSNIVGLTHLDDEQVCDITIKVNDINVFYLTETKPLHHSQIIVKQFGKHIDGEYGIIQIRAEYNMELVGKLLQMGEAYEVLEPQHIRAKIREKIMLMGKAYSH